MPIFKRVIKSLLNKKVLIILFFLITFFPILIETRAADFTYDTFDFDKFAEINSGYWTSSCKRLIEPEEVEKCTERVLKSQRMYYTRLYALLTHYQKRGLIINDNIIILTSFFELTPDLFTDYGDRYKLTMNTDNIGYHIDRESHLTDFDIDRHDENIAFWEKEVDTLELLAKSMIGYAYFCYGNHGAPVEEEYEDGENDPIVVLTCPNGGQVMGEDCIETVDSGFMGFWEYIMARSRVLRFFGIRGQQHNACRAENGNYAKGTEFVSGNKAEVAESKYWEFLLNGEYFDRKPHLQHRYTKILNLTGRERMIDLTEEEKEEYHDEIIEIRQRIIDQIKELLDMYGDTNLLSFYNSAFNEYYWWPVGSNEVTHSNGVAFALGPPASTNVSSPFGFRTHPVMGENSMHNGVDLTGTSNTDNKYNVIAARSGIVLIVVDHCRNGERSCGSGFGNHVILQHSDGNKTVYAHLATGSVIVSRGQSVAQGQILGKMGNTGLSTGVHLHFEVRVNDVPVDPMQFISGDQPRPVGIFNSEMVEMLHCFEGTGPTEGNYYITYANDAAQINITVGRGVNLRWHRQRFNAHGIDGNSIYFVGARVRKEVADKVAYEIMSEMRDSITSQLTRANITLQPHQIDALLIRNYFTGNLGNFIDLYRMHGNTEALNAAFFSRDTRAYGREMPALRVRAHHTWMLFHQGIYRTSACYSM